MARTREQVSNVHRVDGVQVSYQCQLCGHDGPLSEPCQRCEESAEFSEPLAQALLHRLRATRAQLLTDNALRQVLAEKEATILSLRHSFDDIRTRFRMERERRQFGAIAQRYASAKLPETIEAVRCAHMDHILTLAGSHELTPADERCEVLLEALQVAHAR